VFDAANDPRHPLMPPKSELAAPFLNFAPMDNASEGLAGAASRFEKAYASSVPGGAGAATFPGVNALLRQSDEELLLPGGLPKRPWYEHSLYAPGLYTGYGVKTMPGVREAIEQKDWKQADAEILRIAAALARETELVRRAAELLERGAMTRPIP
jgi:N-acetylated-alpha-linked acidic dipeptidase